MTNHLLPQSRLRHITAKPLMALGVITALGVASPAYAVPVANSLSINLDQEIHNDPKIGSETLATVTLTQDGSNVDFKLTSQVGNLPSAFFSSTKTGIAFLELAYTGATVLDTQNSKHQQTQNPNPALFGGFSSNVLLSSFTINPKTSLGYDQFGIELTFGSKTGLLNGQIATWTIDDVKIADFETPVTGSGQEPKTLALVDIGGLAQGDHVQFVDAPPTAPSAVPEPASLGLFGFAALGLVALRRRARR